MLTTPVGTRFTTFPGAKGDLFLKKEPLGSFFIPVIGVTNDKTTGFD